MDPQASLRSEFEQMFRQLAVDVARDVLENARPHIVRWVSEQAIPAVASAIPAVGSAVASAIPAVGSAVASVATSAWRTLASIGSADDQVVRVEATIGPVEAARPVESAPAEASYDVVAVLEAHRAGMSKAEARRRIVATLAARLFADDQLQLVRDVESENGSDTRELTSAVVTLTEQQLGRGVQLMLEATPSLLSEQSLSDLRNILEA
ncbi:hypothetical protein FHX75_111287 [Micromonospora palomenae]|uniref:Uncharacterized protein n=1 Tax=Micromonospora palomenae TaxID=1461247 RepID=A0A561WW85_9ACTN|nr:hypothetical protein [Micromonospora palomenae]TWG28136.1 hypothetical protein FHX75_111287 [Micromonospora palomenae]